MSVQYLVEAVRRPGGYEYHRPVDAWESTHDTIAEAEHAAECLRAESDTVAVGIKELVAPHPIKHGHYGQLPGRCGAGALSTVGTWVAPHIVCARGGAGMALERGAWRPATASEYALMANNPREVQS